jgi:sulfatase maturation enzyme AslB (radical SAM superfamily)
MTCLERLRAITAIVTSSCNLDCAYCYQNARKDQAMPWEVLARTLDLALASRCRDVDVIFMGGEPALEMPLIRRAVSYLHSNNRGGVRIKPWIVTNGLLLDPGSIEFFVDSGFDIHLSFDGVPQAQDQRCGGSFGKLDRLLGQMLETHPEHCRGNLTVVYTLTPSNVEYLGDSVAYFIDKRVPSIAINPCITGDAKWETGRIAELEAQYERILADSIRCMKEEGRIPLLIFRSRQAAGARTGGRDHMCGAALGDVLTVDSDGIVYGCSTMARSYQKEREGQLARGLRSMCMGHVGSPRLGERVTGFIEKAGCSELFFGRRNKYSSYRRCRDCEHIDGCTICPVSIAAIPGNDDPDRVPDFNCACNLVALDHLEKFPGGRNPWNALVPHEEYDEGIKWWRVLARSCG